MFKIVLGMLLVPALFLAGEGSKVLVVVNENVKESVEVGVYYAKKRNIPEGNICRIKCSVTDGTDISNYKKQILEPVLKAARNGIQYIVMTYGTPYMLSINGANYSLDAFLCFPNENISSSISPAKSAGLGLSGYTGEPSQYYNKSFHFQGGGRNFLVTRLDGPTADIAKELVDRALYGEQFITTKYGKGVFDARGIKSGGYYPADQDIIEAGNIVKGKGYETLIDLNPGEVSDKSCPDTLWYFGWYSYNNYNDAFTWKVGAVGIHFDSASAIGIRGGQCWVSQALLRGITATGGAVSEPYADNYTRANLFFKYLLDGYNFAEACYLATPTAKWMMCFVGDPLYSPSFSEKKTDTNKPSIVNLEFQKNDNNPDKEAELFVTADKFVSVKIEYGKDKNDYSKSVKLEVKKIKHNLDLRELKPATNYFFRLTCVDSSGNVQIQEVEYKTAASVPPAIEYINVEKHSGEIILTWEKSSIEDLAGYKLFKMEMSEKSYGSPIELPVDSVSYTDKGLINEKTYAYCLRVVNKDGALSPKTEIYVALSELLPVTNLKAEQKSYGVKISWSAVPSRKVANYEIVRSLKVKSGYKKLRNTTETSLADINVKKGSTYYYKVITKDKNGAERGVSGPLEVKVDAK